MLFAKRCGDLEDIESRLDDRVRALLVTHYFGFPQDISEIRSFCDRHDLILIEDCAHVFFGEYANRLLGSYGDYAFASPMKFFALYDGGLLISSKRDIGRIKLISRGLSFGMKGLATIVWRSVRFKRFGPVRPLLELPFRLRNIVNSLGADRAANHDQNRETGIDSKATYGFSGYFSGKPGEFDPAWIHVGMSWISRLLIMTSSRSRITAGRRKNYITLHNGLSRLPGCRPLFSDLPDSVVPYVYPLVVENPEGIFSRLKRMGVPILRFGEYLWRDFDPSAFPEAVDLSRKVFQFPCHQELKEKELDWMLSQIREIVLAQSNEKRMVE